MFNIFNKNKERKLTKLEEQEQVFEGKLAAERQIAQQEINRQIKLYESLSEVYGNLLEKYDELVEAYRISLEHENFLNEQNRSLHIKNSNLISVTFPNKKFSHDKAINSIMNLTPNSRVYLGYQLIERLAKEELKSELESLKKYIEDKI